jgi:hypothetical protein
MAKTLQWECDGEFNYNVDKYIQTHWNTLKHTINALRYIIGTFKYTTNILYVHSNTFKYIQIHHNHIVSTLKYIQIHYEYIQIHLNIL